MSRQEKVNKERRKDPNNTGGRRCSSSSGEMAQNYTGEDLGACYDCIAKKINGPYATDKVSGELMIGCNLITGGLAPVQKGIKSPEGCPVRIRSLKLSLE